MQTVKLGLIGLGTVGSGVVRLINKNYDKYVRDSEVNLEIVKACARTESRGRELGFSDEVFTQNWKEVVYNDEVDIVIELIGGTGVAKDIVIEALLQGKPVVTANKALVGAHGKEIYAASEKADAPILYEAAVGGGIPILGPIKNSLASNDIQTIAGILNGTTNYILTRMDREGADFEDVLKEAQELGFAEADPSADVDGIDAANKIAILASMGCNSRVVTSQVHTEGIRSITPIDIAYANEMGYKVKLLAIARDKENGIDVRVHPTMISKDHQLANVDGVSNAIYVIGDAVGETMFFGPGAGSLPTASAVVGDIIELARNKCADGSRPVGCTCTLNKEVKDILDLHTKYYIRITVRDYPGVLSSTAEIFARYKISIESMVQRASDGDVATLVYVTHRANERDVQEALREVEDLDCVVELGTVIRVEDTSQWLKGVME